SPYQNKKVIEKEYEVKHATEDLSALDIKSKRSMETDDQHQGDPRPKKVAHLSAGATTVGDAIVEAESSVQREAAIVEAESSAQREALENKEELKAKLKGVLRDKSDVYNSGEQEEDKIKLGTPGWKERKLMTDPNSPIIDFYPEDFEVDMNGKRFAWQGIAKLPFIDEKRLLTEVENVEHTLTEEEARRNSRMCDMLFMTMSHELVEHTLTEEEARRNSRMCDMLFMTISHELSSYIFSLDERTMRLSPNDRLETKEPINPEASGGMNGYISVPAGDPYPRVFISPIDGMEDIMDNVVICVIYKLPDPQPHIARLPAGVQIPKKMVMMADLKPTHDLWHEEKQPWKNRRDSFVKHNGSNEHKNPPGQRLGKAAYRLVINSLPPKPEKTMNVLHRASGSGPSLVSPPPKHDAPKSQPPHGTEILVYLINSILWKFIDTCTIIGIRAMVARLQDFDSTLIRKIKRHQGYAGNRRVSVVTYVLFQNRNVAWITRNAREIVHDRTCVELQTFTPNVIGGIKLCWQHKGKKKTLGVYKETWKTRVESAKEDFLCVCY
nr:5'-3' exoribonuclease 3-like [Tanacetum cinerariifolium]